MFPPCYYFSLKCCSAACLTILTRALRGQKVWSTPRAPDHKQVRAPRPPTFSFCLSALTSERDIRGISVGPWKGGDWQMSSGSRHTWLSRLSLRLACARVCLSAALAKLVDADWHGAVNKSVVTPRSVAPGTTPWVGSLPLLAQTVFTDLYTPNIYFVWWSVGLK